jgi:hypothetical protein
VRRIPVCLPVLLAFAVVVTGCSSSNDAKAVPRTTAVLTTVAPSTTTTVQATTTLRSGPTVAPTTTAGPTSTVAPTTTTADLPGTLLSSEPVDIDDLGVAWRVVYRSVAVAGDPIEVTGIIAAPSGDADGPRPVLSVAHGTTGMTD